MPTHGTAPLEEVTREECLRLLDHASVGRIGVSIHALPVILPVNYLMDDGDVIIRVGRGTKLAAATAGAVVAFEVDHHEGDGTRGWSVLLQGRAEEIHDPEEAARVQRLPLRSWALDGAADHYVRIRPTMISGRRFGPAKSGGTPDDPVR